MSAYSGQGLSWEQGLASVEGIVPETLSFDEPLAVSPVPRPGEVT
jgi:hypothetical protein